MIQPLFLFSDIGLLALRTALGLIMIVHGWPKIKNLKKTKEEFALMGFKPAFLWGLIAAKVEFFGGLMIIFGLLTQIIAFLIFIQFMVAILKVKRKTGLMNGYEFDLLIAAAGLTLVFFGAGDYSLDEFFKIIVY